MLGEKKRETGCLCPCGEFSCPLSFSDYFKTSYGLLQLSLLYKKNNVFNTKKSYYADASNRPHCLSRSTHLISSLIVENYILDPFALFLSAVSKKPLPFYSIYHPPGENVALPIL